MSIWTSDDETVVPPDSASIEGALDFAVQSVCPGAQVSHGDAAQRPAVVRMTILELGRGAPAIPDSAVCTG